MYPTLSDLIKDLFGVTIPLPIQTYGFFVALAFITGAWVLSLEFKRKEKEGYLKSIKKKILIGEPAKPLALISSGLIGFVIGFKLVEAAFHYSEFVDNPQDFILSGRGSWIGGIVIALLSAGLTWYEKYKAKLDKPKWIEQEIHPYQLAGNILVVAGISGIFGAKLFNNLENWDSFMADPIGQLISFSGLTFLGGLIVGFFTVVAYLKYNKINLWHSMDAAAVILPAAYTIGRMACMISGDGCWGIPNPHPQPEWLSFLPGWMWAYNFPHNVLSEGIPIDGCVGKHCMVLAQPVFPTPFYESVLSLIFFIVLWSLRKRIKIPGMLFAIYLPLAGMERFLIEKIRTHEGYDLYNLLGYWFTQAELISFTMTLIGVVGLIYLYINREKMKKLAYK